MMEGWSISIDLYEAFVADEQSNESSIRRAAEIAVSMTGVDALVLSHSEAELLAA